MGEQDWQRMKGAAMAGLQKALVEGRGVDALAMLEVYERIKDNIRLYQQVQRDLGARNALGGALR